MQRLKETLRSIAEEKTIKVRLLDPLKYLLGKPMDVVFTGTRAEIDAWAKSKKAKWDDAAKAYVGPKIPGVAFGPVYLVGKIKGEK